MTFTFMELPEQARQISISRLRLPPRVQNALSRARIYKIDELLSSLETGLDNVNGIGQTAFNTIIGALTALASAVSIDGNIDWTAYWTDRDLEPEEEVEQNTRTMSIDFPDNVKHLSISHLHLPVRAYNTLVRANVLAIEDLLIATNNGLSKIQGLGSSSIDVINSALAVLVDTIGSDGQPNWYQYWQQRKIVIIPRNFKQEISSEQIIRQFPELVREILIREDDDRDWRIIQRRFGLNKSTKLTLEELGEVFGLVRERVRQLERNALVELRSVLIEQNYTGKEYHVHPIVLSTIRALFDAITTETKDYILEKQLFDIAANILSIDVQKTKQVLMLIFRIAGMNRITFDNPDLIAVWERIETDQQDLIETTIKSIDSLLTREHVLPMEEFEILRIINKELSKPKKISMLQLRRCMELCSTIEQRDDGLFWGKFEYLKTRGNQVERVLIEVGEPLSIAGIAREINSRTVVHGQRKIEVQNLSNQISADVRFMPIGKSGRWGLKLWDHIDADTIVSLMERYLIMRNEPATAKEIFEYINTRRPASEASITLYLTTQGRLFRRVNRTHWGLSTWSETENAVTWSPEQVGLFVANIFKLHKTRELEFRIVREALMEAANVNSKQAQGMLKMNPVIQTRRGEQWNERYAVFQPDYKTKLSQGGTHFVRKTATLRERMEQAIRDALEQRPGKQMPLGDLVAHLQQKHGFNDRTAYGYMNHAEYLEKFTIPNAHTKLCRLKGAEDLSFPQLQKINDVNLRESIEKAVHDLTEDDVDIGLFQLGREFEVIIKKCLLQGNAKGRITLKGGLMKDPPTKWKLYEMVDCAKENNLITDLGVANLLRQERNNRAHGSRPSLSERRALLNSAQYLAGLYIDYIILFDEFVQSLS